MSPTYTVFSRKMVEVARGLAEVTMKIILRLSGSCPYKKRKTPYGVAGVGYKIVLRCTSRDVTCCGKIRPPRLSGPETERQYAIPVSRAGFISEEERQ
ncbi:MAG: hypothetical protein K0S39_499, partial [Paenibacillus sp.]|nr:hypothetical protein [Paenibacillus sp.]